MAELKPVQTPLSRPGDWRGFTLEADKILSANLPEELRTPAVRARLIAHASLAVGWNTDPQRCWHHNAWGVKRGSWPGDYYRKATREELEGKEVVIPADKAGATWRAYPSWRVAVADLVKLITGSRYKPAIGELIDEDAPDSAWWEEMGRLGWYTADPVKASHAFADRCRIIRGYLGLPVPSSSPDWRVFALVGIGLVVGIVALWVVTR